MEAVKQVYLLLICQGFYLGSVCQRWTFPYTVSALIGSCVEIPCTYHPAGTSAPSSTVWYLYGGGDYPKILNTKDPSSVIEEYRGRTSLVPGEKSCTLRIDPVREEDGGNLYYPGIAEDRSINAVRLLSRTLPIYVTDKVKVELYLYELTTEGEATIIKCTVEHTCGSAPPVIQWNKPGEVQSKSVKIPGASWREVSELTYIPLYEDDGSPVQCTATYPNGQSTVRSVTLNIYYAPKNVTVTILGMDEVMEGSDVRLQCNSFSNPDVSEYEWYKGKEKSRLPERGREITVRNVTRDMEPYSCTARNPVGTEESALIEIPVLYAPKNVTVTILGMDEVMEGSVVTLQCNGFSNPGVCEYEWYKGKERLSERGREITVRNVTRDMEPYSCTARNSMGKGKSALTQIPIPVLYMGSRISNIIFPAIIGIICLLLLVLLLYCCWRKRRQTSTSNEAKTSPDATYTELVKKDIENEYQEFEPKTSPENTYELVKRDNEHDYEECKASWTPIHNDCK
ncbi:sialic acid-binding Ig-like lectin 13 [Dendropsophus ebraccatus]|uniref:sialic acid-binding Ig-like lectin 13 n=1 Tax=Dendropsophus ebraccatus TaxID=150705 RepID=UPI003831CC2A